MDINVLVVFSSTRGETERLALAVGVGAIQARGNIRLRRLPPPPDASAESMSAGEREAFERMARDYVAPRPADPPWADVLILAPSPRAMNSLDSYVDELPSIGPVAGRIAGVVAPGNPHVASPVYAAAARAGLIVVPAPPSLASVDEQHAFGRQLVGFARALKTARA